MSGSSAGRRKGDHIATPPVLHGWCPVGQVVPRTEVMYLVLKGRTYKAGSSCPLGANTGGQDRRRYLPGLMPPLMWPSRKSLLFSSQEYSMISQSGRSAKVRVFFQGRAKVFGSLTVTS